MNRQRLGILVSTCALAAACGSNGSPQNAAGTLAPPAEQNSQQTGTPGEQLASTPRETAPALAQAAETAAAPVAAHFREITIPAGTTLSVTLENAVASDTSKPEDPVRAKLRGAIVVDGTTVVPAGTEVIGTVLDAKQAGKVKGRAELSVRFNRLRFDGQAHDIRTASISRVAAATKKQDAEKIGIGAGAGAVIGAIAGGKKGAAIGTAVGGGAGTGVVLATRGEEVRLGPGTAMRTTLSEPLSIQVRVR